MQTSKNPKNPTPKKHPTIQNQTPSNPIYFWKFIYFWRTTEWYFIHTHTLFPIFHLHLLTTDQKGTYVFPSESPHSARAITMQVTINEVSLLVQA